MSGRNKRALLLTIFAVTLYYFSSGRYWGGQRAKEFGRQFAEPFGFTGPLSFFASGRPVFITYDLLTLDKQGNEISRYVPTAAVDEYFWFYFNREIKDLDARSRFQAEVCSRLFKHFGLRSEESLVLRSVTNPIHSPARAEKPAPQVREIFRC